MSVPWVHLEGGLPGRAATGPVEVEGDELRHLAARRVRAGDRVVVFDAAGTLAPARVESLRKRAARLEVGALRRVPPPTTDFVLASAIPKAERLSTLLQMLTQLGVGIWQPLVLADSAVRRLDPGARRLQRILVESCKVARRAWALEVRAPIELDAALARLAAGDGEGIFFGDRAGEATGLPAGARALLIGPEAGFAAEERRALERVGARPRSFSPYNLRIETAAIAGAVAWRMAVGAGDEGIGAEGEGMGAVDEGMEAEIVETSDGAHFGPADEDRTGRGQAAPADDDRSDGSRSDGGQPEGGRDGSR